MAKYIGIIALNYDEFVSFRRTDEFEADTEEQAYVTLHSLVDANMGLEDQKHIMNDWCINLDDPSQASLVSRPENRELADTYENMVSPDHRDRFWAEFDQLSIRLGKLQYLLDHWEEKNFTPSAPKELLERQLKSMKEYKAILETRVRLGI